MKSTCSLAVLLAACALLALSGAAAAQTAQTSSSSSSASDSAATAAACPQGWVRNSDGDCDPPKGEVLGFSLAGLNAAASGSTAQAAAPSAPAAPAATVMAAKAPMRGHGRAAMHAPAYRGNDPVLANFALGSADTSAVAQDHVQTFVSHLGKGLGDKRVIVNGHTDARGSSRLNLRLSRQRAEAVKTLLVKAGVAQSAVEVRGHGASHLLRPRHPYAAANRRVDVMVVPN